MAPLQLLVTTYPNDNPLWLARVNLLAAARFSALKPALVRLLQF
jgi:hypothetical protein